MCIFCEIINRNIPSSKIYEDDDIIAILDISQTTKGHTLIIPKKHYSNVLEMPKNEYESLMGKVQDIAKLLINKLSANGCNILINTNEVSGQTVMHAHVHIIPRYDLNDSINITFKENKFDLTEVQNLIIT